MNRLTAAFLFLREFFVFFINFGFEANCEQQLMDDYLKMLKESVLTDFLIKIGDHEIRTHRAILAARSPVFFAMLKHEDTNEVKTVRFCKYNLKFLFNLIQLKLYVCINYS